MAPTRQLYQSQTRLVIVNHLSSYLGLIVLKLDSIVNSSPPSDFTASQPDSSSFFVQSPLPFYPFLVQTIVFIYELITCNDDIIYSKDYVYRLVDEKALDDKVPSF